MDTYEKKYKELVSKIKKAYLYAQTDSTKAVLEDILPELAESEDEKIRKSIIENLKGNMYRADGDYDLLNKQIAWLEKQGNKPQGKSALEAIKEEKVDNQNCVKPSDKVEPKFHEGEWIVLQDKCCKVNYNGCGYELIDQMGLRTSLEYGTVDENAHIWNIIKDAEDGDVLVYGDNPNDYHVEVIMIFKSLRNKHSAFTHFHIFDDEFRTDDWCDCGENAHPANKEQRDALMKAMADAGYTFDFEKKELKKLKKIEQSSAWSEEDEKNLKRAIWYVEHSAINVVKDTMLSEWLKSIKERVQPQPKQ